MLNIPSYNENPISEFLGISARAKFSGRGLVADLECQHLGRWRVDGYIRRRGGLSLVMWNGYDSFR